VVARLQPPTAAVVAARIAAVGIAGSCPNTTVIEVVVADPRVGYTPCGT
jgi:hypothetical protein